jgi:hypothetical protein
MLCVLLTAEWWFKMVHAGKGHVAVFTQLSTCSPDHDLSALRELPCSLSCVRRVELVQAN